MSHIFTTQLEDFDQSILEASHKTLLLVDFWADWCSPCIVLAPVLESLIPEYEGQVLLAKCEVDAGENMKLAGRYQIRGFPSVLLFDKGEELDRFTGAQSSQFIKKFIDQYKK